MADQNVVSNTESMDSIYNDTAFYVDAITSEYGFFNKFIESLGNAGTSINIQRHNIKKSIETIWVNAIEAALPALDAAIRNPNSGIKETEEILPVEFSNHITEKSLRHLAQHTDYISRIEDDMIIPSKILNVYYEENKQTYENKFLNTLIDRLLMFVERRYSVLHDRGMEETELSMDFSAPFSVDKTSGKIHLSIEASMPSGTGSSDTILDRVVHIRKAVSQFKDSPLVKSLEGAMITPPVMRTNAIRKNKYLSQCLELWDFIESYDKVGYSIETDEASEKPNDEYVGQLYSLLSMQYFMFAYNLNNRFRSEDATLKSYKVQPVKPEYISRLEIIKAEKFNIYDTEFRKIVNVFGGPTQHRLTADEAKLRDAVSGALKADKHLMSLMKKSRKKRMVSGDGNG